MKKSDFLFNTARVGYPHLGYQELLSLKQVVKRSRFNPRTLVEKTGFPSGELATATNHPQIREFLAHDIRQGMKLRITGTPTYVVDGKVYEGSIPSEILEKIMQ